MNNKQWDALWINCFIATCEKNGNPYGLIDKGAIAVKDGKIAWIGSMSDLQRDAAVIHDVQGKCITPGLIDCHTHLVYAGNRYKEFEMRLQGASYADIARAGGGIHSTVKATRVASDDNLLQQSLKRARSLIAEGVTTIEIKSGYGLNLETELKILHTAKKMGELLGITVSLTFLGAHTIPQEFRERPDDYVDLVCNVMIPTVAENKLAHSVDVFCESIAFNLEQTRRVFEAAKKYGLAIKCHAEQLSDSGSAMLAAQHRALSVDHLEFLSEASIESLKRSDTVAVLLPGAFYFLRETRKPPVELLRKHGVPIAISTDCNPGTSPITSLLLTMNMGCVLFGLTPEEVLLGVTSHAAKALGLEKTHGTLRIGKVADFVVWDVEHPTELAYQIGFNPCRKVVRSGVERGGLH